MKERTVAELLNEKNRNKRRASKLWPLKKHKAAEPEHIYIYCTSGNVAKRFLRDASNRVRFKYPMNLI